MVKSIFIKVLIMKVSKRKSGIFLQVVLAFIFISLGYMFYDEAEYRNIILSVCFIGALACLYDAIRIYRNKHN